MQRRLLVLGSLQQLQGPRIRRRRCLVPLTQGELKLFIDRVGDQPAVLKLAVQLLVARLEPRDIRLPLL